MKRRPPSGRRRDVPAVRSIRATQVAGRPEAIAEAWGHGTVVRSWLLELIAIGLKEDPELSTLTAYIEDTGEGRWTVQAAIDEDVPAFTITHSPFERFRSRDPNSFSDRIVAMMRKQFGGHAVRPAGHG